MRASSSVRRAASASGSKVITDPGQLGPDLLELLLERLRVFLGHVPMVAEAPTGTVASGRAGCASKVTLPARTPCPSETVRPRPCRTWPGTVPGRGPQGRVSKGAGKRSHISGTTRVRPWVSETRPKRRRGGRPSSEPPNPRSHRSWNVVHAKPHYVEANSRGRGREAPPHADHTRRRPQTPKSARASPARVSREAAFLASARKRSFRAAQAPWHFLNFLPLPHQHGSLRPMFSFSDFTIGRGAPAVDVAPPPDMASVAVAVDVVPPPAAAIASAPASDWCSYWRPPPFTAAACCARCSSSASSGASCAWNSVSTTSSWIARPSSWHIRCPSCWYSTSGSFCAIAL